MSRYLILFCLIGLAPGLLGCESVRKAVGGKKQAPDEFVIYKRPPLALPPEFRLRPPMPGAARLQNVSPREEAKGAILSTTATQTQKPSEAPTIITAGMAALLNQTGALKTDPNIRAKVNAESSTIAAEDRQFIDKLIFWVDEAPYPGSVVDPKKEQQRIMQNEALGKPITEGKVPEVKRRRSRKGLLNF